MCFTQFLKPKRLKLISKLNLITLKNETRNKKIKVIKDSDNNYKDYLRKKNW